MMSLLRICKEYWFEWTDDWIKIHYVQTISIVRTSHVYSSLLPFTCLIKNLHNFVISRENEQVHMTVDIEYCIRSYFLPVIMHSDLWYSIMEKQDFFVSIFIPFSKCRVEILPSLDHGRDSFSGLVANLIKSDSGVCNSIRRQNYRSPGSDTSPTRCWVS